MKQKIPCKTRLEIDDFVKKKNILKLKLHFSAYFIVT